MTEPDAPVADTDDAAYPTTAELLQHPDLPDAGDAGGRAPHRLGPWALTLALLGLVVSFFVGWGFPLGLAAVVVAILSLRRPWESRAVAIWALVLGALSVVYSAGWLFYAAALAGR